MMALKYLLMVVGTGVFGSAGALVVYDIYVSTQLRRLLRGRGVKTESFFRRGLKRRTNFTREIPFVQAKACSTAHR
jgi:hypothetical protein